MSQSERKTMSKSERKYLAGLDAHHARLRAMVKLGKRGAAIYKRYRMLHRTRGVRKSSAYLARAVARARRVAA